MKFTESLKKRKDFSNVYHNGKSKANAILVLYVLPNGLDKNRLGISVSKKVGNSVVRHRITRLVRESYRLAETDFHKGYDLVVIARGKAKGTAYGAISSALYYLAGRHHIYKKPSANGKANEADPALSD